MNDFGPKPKQEEEKTEEQIISEILATKKLLTVGHANMLTYEEDVSPLPEENDSENYVNALEYGSKRLLIYIYPTDKFFYTHIKNKDEEDKKKTQETTLLYSAAKKLMEEISTQTNQTFTYESNIPRQLAAGSQQGD